MGAQGELVRGSSKGEGSRGGMHMSNARGMALVQAGYPACAQNHSQEFAASCGGSAVQGHNR